MRRWGTFVLGMAAGALLLYFALNYHLIRAKDGLHLIPKVESGLASTYIDVTQFRAADWAQHKEVALAVFQAGRGDLIESTTADRLREGLDRLLSPPPERQ